LTYPSPPPPDFRLLLDQGFPKPRGFAVQAVDRTVEVVHLHDLDPQLSMQSTPDWMLYCIAVQAGFDALVARDRRQLDEVLEMYVLSRLRSFAVITWRKAIEDPIREWGQLLAYLPEIKKFLKQPEPEPFSFPRPLCNLKMSMTPWTPWVQRQPNGVFHSSRFGPRPWPRSTTHSRRGVTTRRDSMNSSRYNASDPITARLSFSGQWILVELVPGLEPGT
jgi:hypothetical protein